ncbi:hypothetical protein [Actinoplanes sandaracinus]
MRSSGQRRTRLLAAGAVITAIGGVIGFTQFASAADSDNRTKAGESGAGKVVGNNLTILTDTCVDSDLPAHDGFQKGDRCVSTEFGEVGAAANNPTLLITEAPDDVTVGTPFTLQVSTRNLIRDRFLAAGQGGYYVESSVLQNGLVRGHFHTACRMLASTDEAPESAPVPAFFVATEDRRGGADPDTVTIQVPGLPQQGTAQCASWAGDGSHRIPMMERANQTPALDSVRITVRGAGNDNGGGDNNGGGGDNGGNNNGGNNGGGGNNNGGGGNNTNNGEVKPTTPPAPTTPVTTAPTAPAATTAPTGKPAATTPAAPKPNATTVTATPRTNATTTKTDKGDESATKSGNNGGSNTETNEPTTPKTTSPTTAPASGNEAGTGNEAETDSGATTNATPKTTITKKSAGSEFDDPEPQPTDTDGPALANNPGNGTPDEPKSPTDTLAEPPANQEGPLNLVSSNLAWIGGGAVMVLIGLLIAAFLRARPRNNWR